MDIDDIIKLLKEKEKSFFETTIYSEKPGIYAFFFIGEKFPHFENVVKKHQIIYIGKTESSQRQRDLNTHFATGKTGNSTVRKSIGALLNIKYKLNPIPRNDSDYLKGRLSQFKFDLNSEEKISDWMKNNFAISFYECEQSKDLIDKIETDIIEKIKPILNIDYKNSYNPYKSEIKKLRKECVKSAISKNNTVIKKTHPIPKSYKLNNSTRNMKTIIIDNITEKDVSSKQIRITVSNKELFPEEFLGKPITHNLLFSIYPESETYQVSYKIGSKDGKSRSGILKFPKDIYEEILKIKPNSILEISKGENKYTIKKKK